MSDANRTKVASFWEHLDELRSVIFRVAITVVLLGVVAFFFKDQLFSIILAPKSSDFITYRWLNHVAEGILGEAPMDNFSVKLINTELAKQFIVHITMSIYAAFILVLPYVLYEIFRFVSPALYANEQKYALGVVTSGYFMFMMGVALSYFLIFPLTFRFLGTYQVSSEVENQIVLDSYIGTMMMLNLMMGIVFEIPILCWLFAKMGFISAAFLRKYRRHAIVILLVLAALITPTADVVTLLLVAMPMYLLYELSIIIVSISIVSHD
ncbi:MAG: twin-arginine translocase subunit TatC [Bacteroidales bacterium]